MKNILAPVALSLCLFSSLTSMAGSSASTDEAKAKLQQDLKTAVLDGAITVPQLRQLQNNVDTLKIFREARPGGAVDLLTPYHATADIKRIFSSTDAKYRKALQDDFKAVLTAQAAEAAASNPNPSAGAKLGKDIFKAITFDSPSEQQVQQLQDSLNVLQQLKTKHSRPLQALMKFREAKSQITTVISSPVFAAENRQRVQADLDNLRPQG